MRILERLANPFAALLPAAILLAGCRQGMYDQPRYEPLERSTFFSDGRSARPLPAGVVARGQLDNTSAVHTGLENGSYLETIPMGVDRALLNRGREGFTVFCSPCHGMVGDGRGMIARRGFLWPTDLTSPRVRQAPPGYIFRVITNGYGAMPDYRDQVPVADRWAIIAYLSALQRSRETTIADVPPERRAELERQP